jgi:hypothetical protein
LNDGKQDRIENGGQDMVFRRAVEHPNHTKYETQCYNCNLGAKANGGVCPHKTQEAS